MKTDYLETVKKEENNKFNKRILSPLYWNFVTSSNILMNCYFGFYIKRKILYNEILKYVHER